MSLSSVGLSAVLLLAAAVAGSVFAAEDADSRAQRFIHRYEVSIRPLEIESARRWWDANIDGSDENYRKKEEAETRLEMAFADPKAFAELQAIRDAKPRDAILAREVDVLYLEYLARQIDPELLKAMLAQSNAVEKAFNAYRPNVDGHPMTDSDIRQVLKQSQDSRRRRAAWEGSKEVGRLVAPDLIKLVKLRNEAARKLGSANYQALQLRLSEQSEQQVLGLFDELDALTRDVVPVRQGGDRRSLGPELRRRGEGPASMALPRPVLSGRARGLR